MTAREENEIARRGADMLFKGMTQREVENWITEQTTGNIFLTVDILKKIDYIVEYERG